MTDLVTFADLTTLRVGGSAARLVTAESTSELLSLAKEFGGGDDLLVVSGGSNLLVSDDGFDGTTLLVRSSGYHVDDASYCGGASVTLAAGQPWDEFVSLAIDNQWSGIEALSGIPGLVGATPIQNVGAYGQEVAETIATVRAFDRQTAQVRTLFHADCGFGYRSSVFKEHPGRYVVLEVTFQFRMADLSAPVRYAELAHRLGVEVGDRVPMRRVREAVLELRSRKGMVLAPGDHDTWSCGSFFTNPIVAESFPLPTEAPRFPVDDGRVKTSAAWLIDHAGFGKGHGLPGPAALSTKHALALTNRGDARARDVLALAREIRDAVEARFGIRLVNEPTLVGLVL